MNSLKLKESTLAYVVCKSALYVFFISDGINKLLLYLDYDFNRVSILFRFIYEILFLLIIALFLNRERLLFLSKFAFLFIIFLVGQFIFSSSVTYDYGYIENIIIYNKYFFVLIVFYSLYRLPEGSRNFSSIMKTFEMILLVNSFAAISGLIFQIDLFRTYIEQSYRYGYSGLIPAQNEATLFYFIGISYFYYKAFIQHEKHFKFWIFILASLLLGTKAIYVFLVMLLFFHLITAPGLKKQFIAMLATLLVGYGIVWFLETDNSKQLLSYFTSKASEGGWLEMMLSGRNILLETKGLALLKEWSFINYFIGGQDQQRYLLEMDLFDLFYFTGIVGFILYISMYFSTLFRFNLKKPFYLFFVISFFGLAALGGHFFSSAVNALYLCLACLYFYNSELKTQSA